MQLVGETISTDKTGAATATVSFHEKDGSLPTVPDGHRGLTLTKTETRQQEDGTYVTTGTYEGRAEQFGDSGASGGSDDNNEGTIVEWSPSFEQTDIAKHPSISFLLEKYQGVIDQSTGAVVWPEKLYGSDAGGGLSEGGESTDSSETNPMFGVTSFLSLGGVWSETTLESSFPDDAFSSIGEISSVSEFAELSDRFWLTLPPIVVEHGRLWKVTRRYMLSGVSSDRDVEAAQDIYGNIV